MMPSKISYWLSKQYIFNAVGKTLRWIVVALIFSVSTIAAWVWYGEHRREELIRSYEAPSFYFNMLGAIEGKRPLGTFMNDNEDILCVINSYGYVEKNAQLTEKQKSSVPKSILPSVDSLSWYWIFFTEKAASRIYLVHGTDLDISPESTMTSSCADRGTNFETSRKTSDAPNLKGIVITFSKGEQK